MLPQLHGRRGSLRRATGHGDPLPQVRRARWHLAQAHHLAVGALLVAFALTSLSRAADREPLSISAASSLTEVLPKVAAAWKGSSAATFDFDASSRLANQVASGAPVDLFVSADEAWLNFLDRKGLIDRSSRVDLLTNELVAVVPADSTLKLESPQDLVRRDIRHVALAGENVPAGRYAREALQKVGVLQSVSNRIVNGSNVRQALELAASREVEVAVVYLTDARAEPRVKVAFVFPPNTHAPIVYPAAILKDARHAAEARSFLEFCRSEQARSIFTQAGFGLAPAGR